MSEFNMRVEERIAMWRREYITVEAETLEEAIQKCIDGDYDTRQFNSLLKDKHLDTIDIHKNNPTLLYYNDLSG